LASTPKITNVFEQIYDVTTLFTLWQKKYK